MLNVLCENEHTQTRSPSDYAGWHHWAEKKMRRHYQTRCPTCGLWAMWKRKPKDMADDENPTPEDSK